MNKTTPLAKSTVAALLLLVATATAWGGKHTPPVKPVVPPGIAREYPNDKNRDRIADGLKDKATAARTAQDQNRMVDVELVFTEQITQEQIDAFEKIGGEIDHIYRSVSYGWNGRVPLHKVTALPHLLGDTLILVEEPGPVYKTLDKATQNARARQVWTSSAPYYSNRGSTNITIAILDTGLDTNHMDLANRCVYWKDYTTDGHTSPIDLDGHGTHVAGIALGTGAAAGTNAGTLYISQTGNVSGTTEYFPVPFDLPTGSIHALDFDAMWWGGGTAQGFYASRPKNPASGVEYTRIGLPRSGASPLSMFGQDETGAATNQYTYALLNTNGSINVADYVIWGSIGNYPAVGDGFARMSGVAPLCKYAAAKVLNDSGHGDGTSIGAALDDMVTMRTTNKIKVINMSFGSSESTVRQKANTAVNNGIVVVAAAGNEGVSGTAIAEPGSAAMVITVAAANDTNQLTDYTSLGFSNPSSVSGSEQDYKPDLMAPGGSDRYTYIFSTDSGSADTLLFGDQQANDYTGYKGTSMASPFVAGAAALVINAMEQSGTTWSFNSSAHARFVKNLLLLTASESNQGREGGNYNPTLQRNTSGPNGYPVGKDPYEGFGMINVDAAVQAVRSTALDLSGSLTTNVTLGTSNNLASDSRVWAVKVNLTADLPKAFSLQNPNNGVFDLYLYSTNSSAYGTPIILGSLRGDNIPVGSFLAEFTYRPSTAETAILVVKRVSGYGTATIYVGTAGNDHFANARTIYSSTGTTNGIIGDIFFNYTAESGEPAHQGYAASQSAWWKWTAPSNGAPTFTATTSTFTPCMGVYTGTSVSNLTRASIISSNVLGKIVFVASAGTTYFIAVDTASGPAYPADYTLTWSMNAAPTLSTINTLSGANEDTAFPITYTTLAGAANETDSDSGSLSFRVESVLNGTLKKNSTNVLAGSTLLSSGETWSWTPATNASGTIAAFTVSAYDGLTTSTNTVAVNIIVTNSNDAPVVANAITTQSATYGTAFNYTFPTNTFTDADNQTLTYTASGLPSGISFTSGTRTFSGTPAQTGSSTVSVVASDGALSATNAFTFTVAKAALTATASNASRTYGVTNPIFTGTLNGVVNGDNITANYTCTATTNSSPGTYTITVSLNDPSVRLTNYTTSLTNGTLTISKAALVVTVTNVSRTYGATDPALGGTMTGLTNNDNITAVYNTTAVTNSAPGTYPITVSLSDPDSRLGNYTLTTNTATLTISKATLIVSAQPVSRSYGTTNPLFAPAFSGFMNGESAPTSDVVGKPGFSVSANASSSVGTYTITTTLNTLASTNYSITLTNSTLTVTAAPLTVTVTNVSRAYGAANPSLSALVSGLKLTDSVTASCSTTATTSSPAGVYPINLTLSDPGSKLGNYAVTTNAGFLTITSSLPVITFVTPATNDTINAGGTTIVTVTATDSDGSISKVEFYQGATKFGTVTNSPYTAIWTNNFAGNFTLTATATDNSSATNSVSLPITIYSVLKNPTVTSSNFTALFYGVEGEYYKPQYSSNLVEWITLQNNVRATGPITVIDPTNASPRFYRVIGDE